MRLDLDRRWLPTAALALTLVAAGCGKSTSPASPTGGMDQESADDLAMQTGTLVGLFGLEIGGAQSGATSAPLRRGGATPSAAQWDTTLSIGGITIEASGTFYDAQGHPLLIYGPRAARLDWNARIFGSIEMPRDTATIGHRSDLVFTGLQSGDTLTVNGTALDTLTNRFRSCDGARTRHFHWTSVLSVAQVAKAPSVAWPLRGTLIFTVQADRLRSGDSGDVEAHLNAVVTVTFNGTSQPDIVINNDLAWHYRWNMLTGEVVRV